MATDKAATNIDFTSAILGEVNVRFNYLNYHTYWENANNVLSSPFTLDTVTGSSALGQNYQ